MSLINTLKGTGVALVTPFKKNLEVDYDALERVINFVIDGGVEYLVTLGTTGETPTLNKQEKYDIVNFTLDKAGNRVLVVVGIGGNNTLELVKELQSFPIEKTAAVLSVSPSYNKPSQEGIFQHYKKLAEASAKPVIIYNVPGRTGSNIAAETTLRLANECENIGGIKEASGNMVQCMHILKNRPAGFLIVSGDDQIALPLIACGMDGVISVAANSFPKVFSEMVRYALAGDFARARDFHYKLLEPNDLLFVENNPAGVKAFLAEMGKIENVLRLPLVPLSFPVHQKIKDALLKLG
ncbi:MAG: 4-hydroxy-tetrahydrodipicolinate synthase [Bacteroidota bacterium]|nr:4-hydroxy-tetrahydrodipicolinate synthase [Bacteroidota bacterium]